ncbi:D-lactaldehyde dehydrogenase [Artomyces pyxidatus]|uniref:D-lactaldehyde dehydrogenase n=1 Tax=Artomyces pyxidatus TaxID=48021 RepID=A0ACB8SU71_9AGAM|nr:D-lactaldehyde dehydrogenase [Artomyces pyxidatus]
MPSVLPPSKVLVSGANGDVAIWVVRKLLEAGYLVRGTVRSESKGAHLKHIFAEYDVDGIHFKDGTLDEAVKGVDLVAMSRLRSTLRQRNLMNSLSLLCEGHSSYWNPSSVKRMIVTSSVVAVLHQAEYPIVFNESDWNDFAAEDAKVKGSAAGSYPIYQASKVLAEKATWEYFEKNKANASWDLVTIAPPWVFGPPIHELKSVDELNASQVKVLLCIAGKPLVTQQGLEQQGTWSDVRTVASAHEVAAQKEEAGGERIVVNTGTSIWQDVLDAANAVQPPPFGNIPVGNPGLGKSVSYDIQYDTSKEARILGLKHIPLEQMVADSIADFAARGYAQ